MKFFPINCKTHYSLLTGFSKCDKLAKACADYGYNSCAITDYKTICGAIDFHQACVKHKVKPLIGCDYNGYILIAKNKNGWFELIKLTTLFNDAADIKTLKQIASNNNIICISNNIVYKNIFGSNFYQFNYDKHRIYYVTQDEAVPHRTMLCSGMKTTLPKVISKIQKGEDVENKEFFTSDDFYLKDSYELTHEELLILEKINDACEYYDITEKPMLPDFTCPNNMNSNEYLKELCRHGWKTKLQKNNKVSTEQKKEEYLQRIKMELDVIFNAKLSGYFLIVQDIVNHIKSRGWLAGPGRGSAAGCLVSYLVGITEVDPIEYGLIFERFYNEGRNTEDHISLPDIDIDVPAEHRDEVIEYIKDKYGHDNVSQMITLGKLKGRSAIKEVLRINEAVSFSEMNEITESIPDEAQISDQLEMMDEEDRSIIRWALINQDKELNNWCKIDDDGNLSGPLSGYFEQAIKIEGTNKSQGKHAAGVIISKYKLEDVCPMVKDKTGKFIAGFEMNDLEAQGHVKFDILGIDLLSKIMDIKDNKYEISE